MSKTKTNHKNLSISVSGAARTLEHGLGLSTYAEHVESIRAIGTRFELVLLSLGELLTSLILLAIVDTCRSDRDEEVGIVVAVDEHLKAGTTAEHIVDKSILLDVVHRVAQVYVAHSPSHGAQGLDDLRVRGVVVQAPVSANHGGVVVEYHLMAAMEMIVSIKVLEQLGNLALILYEERLEDA